MLIIYLYTDITHYDSTLKISNALFYSLYNKSICSLSTVNSNLAKSGVILSAIPANSCRSIWKVVPKVQRNVTLNEYCLLFVSTLMLFLPWCWKVGNVRKKLDTFVEFPVTQLDMSRHVDKRMSNSRILQSHMSLVYDLYAVCNHYGNLQGGHYTGEFMCNMFCLFPVLINTWLDH